MSAPFSMPIPNGFRRPKKPTHKKEERREKIKSFLDDYHVICKTHNLHFSAYFNYSPRGQMPVIDVTYLEAPKKPEKNKKKIEKLVEPFLKGYEILKEKHKIKFNAIVEINDFGILPKLNLIDIVEPQTKSWEECQKENEQIRKQADEDRKTMTEEEFKAKYPDLQK